MTHLPPLSVITSGKELTSLIDDLSGQPAIAVDTESNSLYAYHERVCLIQISTPQSDFIVDPKANLDLSPLGDLFADPAIQKVFHAAEQDVAGLKRDLGCQFAHIFDTMWAARILGWARVGLADVLQEIFGVRSNKRYQRYNWGERPLLPEALHYARLDTHYLLPLRNLQLEALSSTGQAEEAAEVFAQFERTEPATSPFGPDAFWRSKGLRKLSPQELSVFWQLYLWRDQEAEQRNRPPFKILGNHTMMKLAQIQPRRTEELSGIKGLSSYPIRRYGQQILEAIAKGKRSSPPRRPSLPSRPDDAVTARYEALRSWRRQVAKQREVDTDVVLPNAVLWRLAEQHPTTLDELKTIENLGPWKRETYGEDLLEILRKR
jgi:ribonuclease D